MVKMSLQRDPETGLISTEIIPENKILAEFLESEIQEDQAFIDYLLSQVSKPSTLPYEINGNAHELLLTATVYSITSLYSDEKTSGPVSDLVELLQQWREFLQQS